MRDEHRFVSESLALRFLDDSRNFIFRLKGVAVASATPLGSRVQS